MYDLKLGDINHALVISIKLTVACRRMVGRKAEIYDDLLDLERAMRDAASECQRVLELIKADVAGPLISG